MLAARTPPPSPDGPPALLDRLAEAPAGDAFAILESGPDGLDEREAADRLERLGRNELGAAGRTSWPILLRQVKSPLFGLLAVAAGVSIGLGEGVEGLIILSIMALSVALGFFNEFRSERTMATLQERAGRRATVVRGGREREVPVAELVPGDLVRLELGDVVPADLRLVEARRLSIEESTLTGEPYPADKRPEPGRTEEGGQTHPTCAYLGTVVRSGGGSGVVVATGDATRLGAVAGGLRHVNPPTGFQRGLSAYARLLAWVTAALTAGIFVVNGALGRPVLDSLLFSLAIAVGLTPQLLPAIVTVSLSTGARRMARRAVLVKRLVAIEDLGDAEILFTDKTGTLTRGEVVLERALTPTGAPDPALLGVALTCSDVALGDGAPTAGNPLDLAIWRATDERARADAAGARRVWSDPFDFERRRTTVALEDAEGRRWLATKGAAEEVIGRCAWARTPSGRAPIDAARERLDQVLDELFDSGFRVVAVARREIPPGPVGEGLERDLELLGLLVFTDPPKADARASVERLQGLGVELKVLTGDHERTAAHVCEEIGVPVRGLVRARPPGGDDDDLRPREPRAEGADRRRRPAARAGRGLHG
jgi:Mg2+-importing ATPase